MAFKLHIISILTFLSLSLSAENSYIASLYNQAMNQKMCGSVTRSDLTKLGIKCAYGQPIENLSVSSWEIYEWSIFQEASHAQLDKNKCLAEKISALQKNKQLLNAWYSQLVALWLGNKKAKLILNICQSEVLSRVDKANVKRYGLKNAYEKTINQSSFKSNKKLPSSWIDVCTDEDQISALKSSQDLFMYSLSVISHSDFFKSIDQYRHSIIDDRTGKPLTDANLLKTDLSDLSFLQINLDPKLDHAITSKMKKLRSERLEINTKLINSQRDGVFTFREFPDDGLKEYMYNDETVFQVLASKSEIGSDQKTAISNGAYCILAKYEPTLTGEILNFAVEAFFWEKAIARNLIGLPKLLNKTPRLKTVTKPIQNCLTSGFGLAGCPMVAEQIYNSCVNKPFKSFKVKNKSQQEIAHSINAANLPQTVKLEKWNLIFDPKETPSCQNIKEKNYAINEDLKSDCFIDALLSVAPLKVSLPVLIYNPN